MDEHAVLLRAYAKAQARCSQLLAEQAAQIVRLRAAVIVRDSALSMVRDELVARSAQGAALPRRLQGLLAPDRLRPRAMPQPADLRAKSVLCIGRAAESAALAQQLVEIAGGRYLHHDGQDEPDAAALEASLRAADLVICQTGCVSHGAYWRVQDHCKRTGTPCVLVGQAQPVHVIRRGPVAETPPQGVQDVQRSEA